LNDWKVQSIGENITEEGLKNSSAKIYTPGTVLIAMYGDGKTITTMGIVDKPSATNQACCALVADPLICDPLYLFYALKERRNRLLSLVVAGAQRNLSVGIIRKFPILMHSLDTQRRIVGILKAYDDLIEVNLRRIVLLEDMARELFAEWFTRRHFPGHEAVAIADTADGPLPAGWSWGSVGNLAASGGKSINPAAFPDEVFAHHSIPAFDDDRYPSMDAGATIQSNKLEFQAPVILVSKLNPRFPRIWYIPDTLTRRQIASTEFVPLIPNCERAAWLYAALRSPEFTERLARMAGGTSTSHQRVKPKDILNAPIAIPSDHLLDTANQALAPMFDMVRAAEAANRNLRAARDLLLPRLISGQLSVMHAERALEAA